MAYEGEQILWNVTATTDLTGSQYLFAHATLDGTLAVAGEPGFVLVDAPASGSPGSVVVAGITKVVAGAAVAIGDNVASDAAGKGVTAVATDAINGIALTAASAADELVTIVVASGVA
jgi:hypothetical protein